VSNAAASHKVHLITRGHPLDCTATTMQLSVNTLTHSSTHPLTNSPDKHLCSPLPSAPWTGRSPAATPSTKQPRREQVGLCSTSAEVLLQSSCNSRGTACSMGTFTVRPSTAHVTAQHDLLVSIFQPCHCIQSVTDRWLPAGAAAAVAVTSVMQYSGNQPTRPRARARRQKLVPATTAAGVNTSAAQRS
jgi:hypothetical protein